MISLRYNLFWVSILSFSIQFNYYPSFFFVDSREHEVGESE